MKDKCCDWQLYKRFIKNVKESNYLMTWMNDSESQIASLKNAVWAFIDIIEEHHNELD